MEKARGDPAGGAEAGDADAAARAEQSEDAREAEFGDAVVGPARRPRQRRRRRLARLALRLSIAGGWFRQTGAAYAENMVAFASERNLSLWLLALLVGTAVGMAAVVFRLGIGAIQWVWFGEASEYVIDAIRAQPWWLVLLAPTAGGLVVGLMNQYLLTGRRPGGVADVMEAAARGGGRGLGLRNGLWSALATVVSLGSGASAGREGPVIHLGAILAAVLCQTSRLPPQATRIVLACGVASAISASFNAPIAGVLFAHEVILRHYALSAFVPIVIASVCGTVAGRIFFGEDGSALPIPELSQSDPYPRMRLFALLGVVAAIVAISFQFVLSVRQDGAGADACPTLDRPRNGGLVVRHYDGIQLHADPRARLRGRTCPPGADSTSDDGDAPRGEKIFATAITLASRFGGGHFSPPSISAHERAEVRASGGGWLPGRALRPRALCEYSAWGRPVAAALLVTNIPEL